MAWESLVDPFAMFGLDNELILTTLSFSRWVFMSDTNNLKASSGSVIKSKLSAHNERLAEIRERQRRERKEELYSYSHKKS